jgi:hypothetical protein
MNQEWLEYLKEQDPELYLQAKNYIENLKTQLEEKELIVENYRNLISSIGFFADN